LRPKQPLLHRVTAPLFFGRANDIAVAVESVSHAPMGDQASVVACDHITYFTTPASLGLLAQLLPQP
jgi:hypothetical protein